MLFSLRHKRSLFSGDLKPSLTQRLRRSLLRTLEECCTASYDEWGDVTAYEEIERAKEVVLRDTGKETLCYRDDEGNRLPGTFGQIVVHGFPDDAMDLVEACLAQIDDGSRPRAQERLNAALASHGSPWRMANGEFFRMDSRYFGEEVLEPVAQLLDMAGFEGPLREFADARSALMDGRADEAVVDANKSLESVIKALLGIDREMPGRLLRRLIESGRVPEYHQGFLESLDKIMYSVVAARSEPGRAHGTGEKPRELPHYYAEFVINLAGVLILFLLRQEAESTSTTEVAQASEAEPEEEHAGEWEDCPDEDVPPPWMDE
jgi:HEPN domain-containing protein